VNSEEAECLAKEIKADIFKEVSAKENKGVQELFKQIAQNLY